eukprot:TRINITY_DN3392_c0_g1_i2.p1 TRINITY_DN3392_c0_g1~~TRINITY_DN3392_c0_g1_i2.p1  ORF type:complete len:573 (+),score=101.06 TRINITY_DN3392_c0_g1_i2:172-1890(+)
MFNNSGSPRRTTPSSVKKKVVKDKGEKKIKNVKDKKKKKEEVSKSKDKKKIKRRGRSSSSGPTTKSSLEYHNHPRFETSAMQAEKVKPQEIKKQEISLNVAVVDTDTDLIGDTPRLLEFYYNKNNEPPLKITLGSTAEGDLNAKKTYMLEHITPDKHMIFVWIGSNVSKSLVTLTGMAVQDYLTNQDSPVDIVLDQVIQGSETTSFSSILIEWAKKDSKRSLDAYLKRIKIVHSKEPKQSKKSKAKLKNEKEVFSRDKDAANTNSPVENVKERNVKDHVEPPAGVPDVHHNGPPVVSSQLEREIEMGNTTNEPVHCESEVAIMSKNKPKDVPRLTPRKQVGYDDVKVNKTSDYIDTLQYLESTETGQVIYWTSLIEANFSWSRLSTSVITPKNEQKSILENKLSEVMDETNNLKQSIKVTKEYQQQNINNLTKIQEHLDNTTGELKNEQKQNKGLQMQLRQLNVLRDLETISVRISSLEQKPHFYKTTKIQSKHKQESSNNNYLTVREEKLRKREMEVEKKEQRLVEWEKRLTQLEESRRVEWEKYKICEMERLRKEIREEVLKEFHVNQKM